MEHIPSIVLKPGKDKPVRNRHPWVFSGAISKLCKGNPSVVAVVSHDGTILGYGYYSPKSQIVVRIFEFEKDNDLFEADYWNHKIQSAYQRRLQLQFNETNAYRLVHAEADGCPGWVIDIYNQVAVVQMLMPAVKVHSSHIFASLRAIGIEFIYVKHNKTSDKKEELTQEEGWDGPSVPMPISILENGITFLVNVEQGQKTGFFLDQRDNRALLGHYSIGKRILNTFSYTGGFSAYALAKGAAFVKSVDISADAVAQSEANVLANVVQPSHEALKADVFQFLREDTGAYDIIVLDPPAFAKNAHSVQNAARGYKDLNRLAFKKLERGGLLFTFSCSQHISADLFQKIVFSAALEAKKDVAILHRLSQPADHPVSIYHPEGEYLKGLVLHVGN